MVSYSYSKRDYSERMVNMLSVYLILLVLSLPLTIPMAIVALIVHFVKKDKRKKQLAAYDQMQTANIMNNAVMPDVNDIQSGTPEMIPQQPFTAPQPYYQTENGAPVPPPAPVKPKKQREPLSSSTVMLLIGTALVVLSGIAFGAANWLNTTPMGRVGIIFIASIVSFLISLLFGKGVKLKGTSTAFYIVGSLMIPVAMVIAGFYDLMGDWFAVNGDGRFMLYAVGFAMTAGSCILGKKLYNGKHFIYTGLIMTSLAMFFTAIQLSYFNDMLLCGVFGAILILMQAAITASIHVFRLHEKTTFPEPIKLIGGITAVFYGFTGFCSAMSEANEASFLTYFVLLAIIAQLIGYGIAHEHKWMLGAQSLFSILLVWVIGFNAPRTFSDETALLLTAYLLTALYFINRFVPKMRNVFSSAVTFIGMFSAAIMTLVDINRISLFSALIIPIIFSAVVYAYVFDNRKVVQEITGLASPIMPCIIAAALNTYQIRNSYSVNAGLYTGMITSTILLVITAAIMYLPKYAFEFYAKHPRKTDAVLYSGLAVSLVILLGYVDNNKIFILVPLIIAAANFFLAYQQKNNILSVGSVIIFISYILRSLEKIKWEKAGIVAVCCIAFLVMMALSRIFYRTAAITRNEGRTVFDVPLFAAWSIIPFMLGNTAHKEFFGFLTAAIYIACFIKKNTTETQSCSILSASAVLSACALMTRPFFVPENMMISNKITFAIIALTGAAFRVIWRKHEHGAKRASNIIFVCTFAALMMDALYFEDAGNTVFVLAVTTAILIASFVFRSKTWFSVSSIALVSIVVYSLKDFFGSLSGWVYLFAAGLILIGVAAVNEYCKQNGENVKTRLAHAFSDWKW